VTHRRHGSGQSAARGSPASTSVTARETLWRCGVRRRHHAPGRKPAARRCPPRSRAVPCRGAGYRRSRRSSPSSDQAHPASPLRSRSRTAPPGCAPGESPCTEPAGAGTPGPRTTLLRGRYWARVSLGFSWGGRRTGVWELGLDGSASRRSVVCCVAWQALLGVFDQQIADRQVTCVPMAEPPRCVPAAGSLQVEPGQASQRISGPQRSPGQGACTFTPHRPCRALARYAVAVMPVRAALACQSRAAAVVS
jgi:hypothetical protein